MNGQLPPIDPAVRGNLARRSAGRLPEGLLAATYAALDVAPSQPRRLTWRLVPRMAVAGSALALTAILAAALLVIPRSQVGPAASGLAGYPAQRALTTAELALLMSGPTLPSNTALVADVVIDIRSDVCPMDRYGTVGIVEGMNSQICVMTASDVLTQPVTIRGIMAFRYLAPGYLGLLGEITPASPATVAFHANDEWPLADKPFLVEGWLGSSAPPRSVGGYAIACPLPLYDVGDPLNPAGADNTCKTTWLAGDPSAVPSWEIADGRLVVSVQGGHEVGAGGARLYDSISNDSPVKGVYVVRSVTEQCTGALPQDSRGCSAWRVLAKVADVSVPPPRGTPLEVATVAPTTAPPATPITENLTGVIGTGNQPLSVDELETLMVTQPDHLAGRIVISAAPIPTQISCQSDANGGGCAVNTKSLAETGVWAVRIGADGALSLAGQIAAPTVGGYVSSPEEARTLWNTPGSDKALVLVDAWIGGLGADACDVAGQPCYEVSWLASTPDGPRLSVQPGAYHMFGAGSIGGGPAIKGIFLVQGLGEQGQILARLESVTP